MPEVAEEDGAAAVRECAEAYLETMQDITINVTNLFFTVLSAQENYRQSVADYEDRKHLFEIAKKRLDLGTTTKSEVLQMELSLLNAKMSVNSTSLTLRTSCSACFLICALWTMGT